MWYSVNQTQFQIQFYILIGQTGREGEIRRKRQFFLFFFRKRKKHVITFFKLHLKSYQLIYFSAGRHNHNVNKTQRDLNVSKIMNKDDFAVFISHRRPTGSVISYMLLIQLISIPNVPLYTKNRFRHVCVWSKWALKCHHLTAKPACFSVSSGNILLNVCDSLCCCCCSCLSQLFLHGKSCLVAVLQPIKMPPPLGRPAVVDIRHGKKCTYLKDSVSRWANTLPSSILKVCQKIFCVCVFRVR